MKRLIILMALSLLSVTVSAQEVVEAKADKSYLEGREFLQKMNKRTQGHYEAIPENNSEQSASKEFSKQTQDMIRLMKSLNARQETPAQQEHDADSARKSNSWDRADIDRARRFVRRLGDNTNPKAPSNKNANPAGKKAHGTR